MQMWYAHQNITTLKLTELPDDYPARYNFPAGVTANTVSLHDYRRNAPLCNVCASLSLSPSLPE